MQMPTPSRAARWSALTLVAVLAAAGCTNPPEATGPESLHEDADQDGIPDGRSPDPWVNDSRDDANATPSALPEDGATP